MKITCYLSTALLMTAAASAHAIDLAPLASMGGQLYAASEVCKMYSDQELQALKAKHKSELAAKGVSAEVFDKHFEIGYSRAQQDLKTMSAEQKEKMCAELAKIKS